MARETRQVTLRRVKSAVEEAFPGALVELRWPRGSMRLSGHAIWAGFDDMGQIDRQRLISSALTERLGPAAEQVSMILAYTPLEIKLMDAA